MQPKIKVFEAVTGSHLYGTNVATSDLDIITVYQEPKEVLIGIQNDSKLSQNIGEEDSKRYWVRRFCALCGKGNPNVLESIFAPVSQIRDIHGGFARHFLKNPSIFLFKKPLIDSHLGYAHAQIKRMDGTNLGTQRKNLAAQYGYDIKFAAHAYRLVAQLMEILIYGKIRFPYPDPIRDTILDVRKGMLTREEFMQLYADTVVDAEKVIEKYNDLPSDFDVTKINLAVMNFYEEIYWTKNAS